ncbi:FAD-binding oxidoreductase [Amycolatopsis cihanbeyliensis]|uniref:Ferredoxin-NADP reductase n=1 Tax=Amycolatopsis cihanbeyliensis TaxID=1128664 RepID=A0A542DR35_AMYCI|nr:FAD-binding oxidoreductase [Amycolatopsis cihanbeyliensis]TQJ05561.1 ferredoxin-NADP reductase [Amycolatopsis cihanbeyliensis]
MTYRSWGDPALPDDCDIPAEVVTVGRVARDVLSVVLRPSRRWRGFGAGQYVRLAARVEGARRTRCYPLAGSQHRADGRIELAVQVGGNRCLSRHLERVRPGAVLELSRARGGFTLPKRRPRHLLLIGAECGIVPLLSMLRTLADECHTGAVALLHYAGADGEVPYREELVRLRDTCPGFQVSYAHPDRHGPFSPAHLLAAAPWYPEAETYLCAGAVLNDAVRRMYRDTALDHRLHTGETVPVPRPRPTSWRGSRRAWWQIALQRA